MLFDLLSICALCATMLVVALYGAGLRRPFGSLPRIPDVPYWLWDSSGLVLIADFTFALFAAVMLYLLWQQVGTMTFIVVFSLVYAAEYVLSHKVPLVPSFFRLFWPWSPYFAFCTAHFTVSRLPFQSSDFELQDFVKHTG